MKPIWLLLATAISAPAVAQNPTPAPLPATRYDEELAAAQRRLAPLTSGSKRDVAGAVKRLEKITAVRRSDGEVQPVDTPLWTKRLAPSGGATRSQWEEAQSQLQAGQSAARDWALPRDGSFYTAADAGKIVRQLEATGQIRTGPTQWQKWMADVQQWFADLQERIRAWFSSLLPNAPNVSMPSVNPGLMRAIYIVSILGVLAIVALLTWKVLQGRLGRLGARRDVVFVGQDADLMQLPPEELEDRAVRYAREGNFREALRHRYLSLLVLLDQKGVWRYDPRRTNWEHIALLRRDEVATLAPALAGLTRRFDRVRYGGAACSEVDWQSFDQDVSQLRGQLSTNR